MFWPSVEELPDVAVESKTLPPKSKENITNFVKMSLEQTYSELILDAKIFFLLLYESVKLILKTKTWNILTVFKC